MHDDSSILLALGLQRCVPSDVTYFLDTLPEAARPDIVAFAQAAMARDAAEETAQQAASRRSPAALGPPVYDSPTLPRP